VAHPVRAVARFAGRLTAAECSGRTRGLRVRCSAFPHVHRRPPVQVTVVGVPPWTVLDAGELQRKLQRRLAARIRVGLVDGPPPCLPRAGHSLGSWRMASTEQIPLRDAL
jgi:hypothetical protein